MTKRKNPHIGSSFDDFLREEHLYEEVTATAIKRAIALQIANEMTAQNITKAEMARRMKTSPTQLGRRLDPGVVSLVLPKLNARKYWIDMESGVRLDGVFSISLCEAVLREVFGR